MISRLGLRFAAVFQRVTPDPLVLAVGLSFLVIALALVFTPMEASALLDIIRGDKGLWALLRFTMQMLLVLVTGHALASAPQMQRIIGWLSGLPKSGRHAVALVAAVAMCAALLNWGLGLIVGALLAREVGIRCRERGVSVHYPLLCAAGYSGLAVWHGGLSGSAPLKMTRAGDVTRMLGEELGAAVGPIPLSETVFSSTNLIITGGLFVVLVLAAVAMSPDEDMSVPCEAERAERKPIALPKTFAERLENSWTLCLLLACLLGAASYRFVTVDGFGKLDPNALNLIFLSAGLILHGSLRLYREAVTEAVANTAGIVLQFPLYAAIMGVMRHSGLAAMMGAGLAATSAKGFIATTVLTASALNFFVPSGGGQWAVQGTIALTGGHELGVSPALTTMAVAYGDQLTNLLQPFWALPLLAITGVRARDMLGYTALMMVVGLVWVLASLMVLAG